MTGDKKTASEFKALRRKAEQRIQEKSSTILESLESLTPAQAQELLQELRIHQVELEMQNEELRRAQENLEASRNRYFELYDLAPVGYLTLSGDGVIQQANLTAARLLQQERGDLPGRPFIGLINREDQDSYYLYGKQLLQAGSQQLSELRLGRNDGYYFWARLEMTVALDMDGKVSGYRAVFTDISEHKRAEAVLKKVQLQLEQMVSERTRELVQANKASQESEEHFRQIVEALPVAVFGQYEKEIVFSNNAAAKLLRAAEPESLQGRNIMNLLHTEYKELFRQNVRKIVEGSVGNVSFPARLFSLKGKLIDVELYLTPFTYRDQAAVQVSAYDISRRKKSEKELLNRDKLETVGKLGAGVAHDFNNYLASLLGNVSLAKVYISSPEKLIEKLENMEKIMLRAKDLTNQLSVFAKGGAPIKKRVVLKDLISDSINFSLCGSKVQYELILPDALHGAEIDEGQISQVLSNIVLNAVEAMPEGGTIRVKGENVSFTEEINGDYGFLSQGEYVKISLTDEGPGIPEKIIEKIYEPFFSTKSKGSGLGLATSYHIIKNHGGYIQAESVEGSGTTFIVYLPACRGVDRVTDKNDEIIYGTGRVLLMDDEAEIREASGEMLALLSYDPVLATDGTDALEMYQRAVAENRPFDLVVLDLTIPGGMGGQYVLEQLLKIDPAVKGIVCSGYADDPVMANYFAYGFKGVITKPYAIKEFSQTIHKVITGT